MIRLENVTKVYKGDVTALRGVNLEIQRGEFVFLVGQSGSGKSTFIRLLNREEVADSGKILLAGKDLGSLRSWSVPALRRNIGCIFQDYKLLEKKTVAENVAFALEVIGQPRPLIRKQVPAILDLVGLSQKADRFPDELSGGEQQRVSIARAFANRPTVMLADEPTGNLDPKTSIEVMDILIELNQKGNTILMATHDFILIDKFPSRTYICELGKISEIDIKNKNINSIYK